MHILTNKLRKDTMKKMLLQSNNYYDHIHAFSKNVFSLSVKNVFSLIDRLVFGIAIEITLIGCTTYNADMDCGSYTSTDMSIHFN